METLALLWVFGIAYWCLFVIVKNMIGRPLPGDDRFMGWMVALFWPLATALGAVIFPVACLVGFLWGLNALAQMVVVPLLHEVESWFVPVGAKSNPAGYGRKRAEPVSEETYRRFDETRLQKKY
jgi:hypothetical protein